MRPGSEMILDTQQHPHVLKSGNKNNNNNKARFYDQDREKDSSNTKAKPSPPSGNNKSPRKGNHSSSLPSANAKSKPIAVNATSRSQSSGSIAINTNSQLKSHILVGYGIQHQMALAAQVQYHKARLARNGGPDLASQQQQPRPKAYTPPNTQSIIHARNVLNKRNGGIGGGNNKAGGNVGMKGGEYYAGAKFDTVPSIAVLPSPPVSWTDPALRSQSQPSSPIPKMMQQQPQPQISSSTGSQFSVDLATLFGVNRFAKSELLMPKVAQLQVKVGC